MHETAAVIKSISKCTLTEEQKNEFNWEKVQKCGMGCS